MIGKEGELMQLDHIYRNPLDDCLDLDAVAGTLEANAQSLGLPFYSYVLVKHPDGATSDAGGRMLTSYDREWHARYERKLYRYYDPVVQVAAQSRLPFFWDGHSFLRPFRKAQRRVFHEARAFDICCGYSIPIAGPAGDIGLFSLAGSRESDLIDVLRGAGHEIHVMAFQAHDRVSRLAGIEPPAEKATKLSSREIECLKWAAEGLTSEGIAATLAVSAATVNYHLTNAMRKLGAVNRHHAAIKAVRAKLI